MLHRQYEGSSIADSETFQTSNSLNIILTDQPHALRTPVAGSNHAALTALMSQYHRVPRAGLLLRPTVRGLNTRDVSCG